LALLRPDSPASTSRASALPTSHAPDNARWPRARFSFAADRRAGWPIGELDDVRELVVYRGLAAAVKCNKPEDIADACAVPIVTVQRWQKALNAIPVRERHRRESDAIQKRIVQRVRRLLA
jgi:hypothetical protein